MPIQPYTVQDFSKDHAKDWTYIKQGQEIARKNINTIREIILTAEPPLLTSDAEVVLYGSLARGESTLSSDVDWTLLIDGPVNEQHSRIAKLAKEKIKEVGLKDPGGTGLFGRITFSHELVHYIGGQDDTNHNLSRRILLLLESIGISALNDAQGARIVHARVLKAVIGQYIAHDSGLASNKANLPRFLLNDFVRYWRTLCVDFAYKQREHGGEQWALRRDIKLRMSRKLLFVKGLLMCFYCYKEDAGGDKDEVAASLLEMTQIKPLDMLFALKEHFNIQDADLVALLDAYDQFLEILFDEKKREHFKNLPMTEIYNDEDFLKAQTISDEFQATLDQIFIGYDDQLKFLTLKYGLF